MYGQRGEDIRVSGLGECFSDVQVILEALISLAHRTFYMPVLTGSSLNSLTNLP